MPHFKHKEIFRYLKSQLLCFMSDLSENLKRCASYSRDYNWLALQSQLGHFKTDFEHKGPKNVNFFTLSPICLEISEYVQLARFPKSTRPCYGRFRTKGNIRKITQ